MAVDEAVGLYIGDGGQVAAIEVVEEIDHVLNVRLALRGIAHDRGGILGRVDELFDDNPHGNEMDQSQKGLAQFLIPRGNASKLLEIVEEPFDLLTEFVEVFIIV